VNSRDEALCGRGSFSKSEVGEGPELARLHVIFFDSTLCQVASLLRVGTLQLVVAMIEAGQVDADLTLDDPLAALEQWNADPTLAARARTTNGSQYTAVELRLRFLEAAKRFVDAGGCSGIVPRANEIVDLWEDTLHKLRDGDFVSLSRRLDWVLKRNMLQRVMSQRALTWTSPELKHLDQLFASLDQAEGLFWAFERAGAVDRIIDDQLIRRALDNPPDDTRAWTRAQLLRMASNACEEVDWDVIRLRLLPRLGGGSWLERRSVHLPVPYGATKGRHESIFQAGSSLEEIVDAIEASGDVADACEAIVTPDYPVC
jgi:proteasome accessory factor A